MAFREMIEHAKTLPVSRGEVVEVHLMPEGHWHVDAVVSVERFQDVWGYAEEAFEQMDIEQCYVGIIHEQGGCLIPIQATTKHAR